MNPPLKWAGGKRKLAESKIRPIWEGLDRPSICEPFMGSAAVTLALEPATAVLGDTLRPLCNFMEQWLIHGLTMESHRPTPQEYLEKRTAFNKILNGEGTEAARLFWELNK